MARSSGAKKQAQNSIILRYCAAGGGVAPIKICGMRRAVRIPSASRPSWDHSIQGVAFAREALRSRSQPMRFGFQPVQLPAVPHLNGHRAFPLRIRLKWRSIVFTAGGSRSESRDAISARISPASVV
jgi:hypothetical protein